MTLYRKLAQKYRLFAATHIANLSRLTSLLVIANITLFFLTGLVTTQGYYWTCYSLGLLLVIEIGLVIPTGLFDRLGFYLALLTLEIVAAYFLVASGVYWVSTSWTPGLQ